MTDGGGNQKYTLVNLCEVDYSDVKRLQRFTLVPFEDQSGRLVKDSRRGMPGVCTGDSAMVILIHPHSVLSF